VKVATDANPNPERGATLLFFTFADGKDQIVAFGAADYSPSAPEFDAGRSIVRPVLAGSGSTWVPVARSAARGMPMVPTRKYSRY
jgi:hypothetical protein